MADQQQAPANIDYDALAAKHGAIGSTSTPPDAAPPPSTPPSTSASANSPSSFQAGTAAAPAPGIDYDALAAKHGAIGSTSAPPTTTPNVSGPHAGGGKYNSYMDMAIGNSPSGADPQNPGNPNLNAVPESERGNVNDNALATAVATTPITALVGPALEWLGIGGKAASEAAPAVKQVGTGLFDQFGKEVMKDGAAPEVKAVASKIFQNPAVQKAVKTVVRKLVGEEAGRRIGGAVGGTTGAIAGGSLGAALGDKALSWILSE